MLFRRLSIQGWCVMAEQAEMREAVRQRYATAALSVLESGGGSCCGPSGCGSADPVTADLYEPGEAPSEGALAASLGCGNPTALIDLVPGQTVLDLGSGGGLDVLLSARRVAPGGVAYGLDMTDEMLALAERNRAEAGTENARFVKGTIEDVPLPSASVDVVISNCVINLSTDKDKVLAEAFRVLRPGGRFAVSDIVLLRPLPAEWMPVVGLWTGCVSGALLDVDYLTKLAAAGFANPSIQVTRTYTRDDLAEMASELDPESLPAGAGIQEAIAVLEGAFASAFIRADKENQAGAEEHVPAIKVFEGPLCCNTGVCGADPAQALVDFTADARWVADQGVPVARANLAQDPAAFAADGLAVAFLKTAGAEGLPLVTMDGVTVLAGRYPTRAELARYAGLSTADASTQEACCGGAAAEADCCTPAVQTVQVASPSGGCCGGDR